MKLENREPESAAEVISLTSGACRRLNYILRTKAPNELSFVGFGGEIYSMNYYPLLQDNSNYDLFVFEIVRMNCCYGSFVYKKSEGNFLPLVDDGKVTSLNFDIQKFLEEMLYNYFIQ